MFKRKEEQLIDEFYKAFLQGRVQQVGTWLMVGLCLFFEIFMSAFPVSEIIMSTDGDANLLFLVFVLSALFGAFCYVNMYQSFMEGQGQRLCSDVLQYIPVAYKDLCIYKTKKLFVFLARITGIALALQVLVAFLRHNLSIWNVVYIFVVVFLLPFLWAVLYIWLGDKNKKSTNANAKRKEFLFELLDALLNLI